MNGFANDEKLISSSIAHAHNFSSSESIGNFKKKRQFSCLNIVHVCLQGSGQQFGVTVETLTGSHPK